MNKRKHNKFSKHAKFVSGSIVFLLALIFYLQENFETGTRKFIFYIYVLIALVIIIIFCYILISKRYSKKSTRIEVKDFIKTNFSDYDILGEITPNNINKTFLLSKNSDKYVLKISEKNKKHMAREAAVLHDLQSFLLAPKLISNDSSTLPSHILMSHCGIRLTTSNNQKDYYNLGKIISNIHNISVQASTRKLLVKNKSKKIKRYLTESNTNHPYVMYLKKHKHLPQNYFSHGDLHLNQILINDGKISIIDWESACLSYRIYDLAKIISHCLKQKLSINLAQSILYGYTAVSQISNKDEIKLLLGLIWCDLQITNLQWINSKAKTKRVEFIHPLLKERNLERILKFNISD